MSRVLKLKKEREALDKKIAAEEKKQAAKLGQLCIKAGLGDIEATPKELQSALAEVASRFQRQT